MTISNLLESRLNTKNLDSKSTETNWIKSPLQDKIQINLDMSTNEIEIIKPHILYQLHNYTKVRK